MILAVVRLDMNATAEACMTKKKAATKPKSRPKGRPKGAGRITTRHAIVAKPEWLAWLDDFRSAVPTPDGIKLDRSGAIDYALRLAAEKLKKPLPPPRF